MKRFFFSLIILLMTINLYAEDDGNIYAFGVSTSFNDSIVYLSTVQRLEGAQLAKKTGFLVHRSTYSGQFQQFLDSKYQNNQTCALFFSKDRTSLEKKYLKLRNRINKDNPAKLKEISSEDFQFSKVIDSTEAQ